MTGEAGRRGSGEGGGGVVRLLVALYPAEFRRRYGAELGTAFDDGMRAARVRGRAAAVGFAVRTAVSMVGSAVLMRLERRLDASGRAGRRGPRDGVSTITPPRSGGSMDRFGQDLRFALRFLRRNPLYAAMVVATLALGIGMNTAAFSVLYGVVFQPLPYPDASSLVQVGRTHPTGNWLLPLSPASSLDIRDRVRRVERVEVETPTSFVLTDRGDAARYGGSRVSAGFFDLLGRRPSLGRTFSANEDQPGAEKVVVLSDGFWRAQFAADPAILGQTIRLNDTPHTVIGVMPPTFNFARASLWVPFEWDDATRAVRGSNYLRLYARLAPGATVEQATEELERIWAPMRAEFPAGNEDTGLKAIALQDLAGLASGRALYIISGAALCLLLIACANVANLTLVRAEHRQREIGVRSALGAGRSRIARQFLTEAVLLSVIGGAFGVWVAYFSVRALLAAFGTAVPRVSEIGIHPPVLLFTLVVSVATGLLVGLLPALRSRPDHDMLREGSRGGTARFTRYGKALVVIEIALALMLVTGAALLLKSYDRATNSQLGFAAGEIVAANIWFPSSRYQDTQPAAAFMDRLLARIEARPEVHGAALSSMVPVREFGNNWTEMRVIGRPDAKASFVENRSVTPDFFETLGIQLLAGRLPTAADAGTDGAAVVVVNRTLARQLFGDDDPLGHRLDASSTWQPEIVGVVSDLRDFGPDQQPRPTLYVPTLFASSLILRTSASAGAVGQIVRAAIAEIDPNVQLVRIQHMDEIVDGALSSRRFQLTLIGVFAITALLLACVGIYGVLSYTVSRQTREIGVRMALGARASGVAALVVWRGGRLALAGVVLGLGGALAVRRVIASLLFEVQAFDPAVYLGVAGVLLAVAAAACFVPARRAAGVEPGRALRME
jgi:predicted permease